MKLGNMTIKAANSNGNAKVLCHCGHLFNVAGLVMVDGTISKEQIKKGEVCVYKDMPVTCPDCECAWETESDIPPSLRKKPPVEMKFFISHVMMEGSEEAIPYGTGQAPNMNTYIVSNLADLPSQVTAFTCSEATQEEAVALYRKVKQDRPQGLLDIVEAIFGSR